MYLHSIAPAFPEHTVTQAEVLELLTRSGMFESIKPRSRSILEKVLTGDSGIQQRHSCSRDTRHLLTAAPHDLAKMFETAAPSLAGAALRTAMTQGGVLPGEIDALFVCTCTGYLCPGVSSHVAESLGLRPDAVLHDLVGLGCGAAIPTLRAASHYLAAHPDHTVAAVAVEVCSAAFYVDDDPGVLISLCLFGDGACATLWRGDAGSAATSWRAHGFRSLHKPEEREKIRFVNANGRLRNQLHRSVPGIAAAAVHELHAADTRAGMDPATKIISHSGGRDVIDAIKTLLPGHLLEETSEVLRTCGNMSSPSVLVALHQALAAGQSDPLWLTAFGAGFSAHSCRMTRE